MTAAVPHDELLALATELEHVPEFRKHGGQRCPIEHAANGKCA